MTTFVPCLKINLNSKCALNQQNMTLYQREHFILTERPVKNFKKKLVSKIIQSILENYQLPVYVNNQFLPVINTLDSFFLNKKNLNWYIWGIP